MTSKKTRPSKKIKTAAKPLAKSPKPAKSEPYQFQPIGFMESCFKEKFGIPRQPGLVRSSQGVIKLKDHPDLRTAIRSLESFSHLWIVFVFHEHGSKNWKPSIRPPRLGGARKVGVLASRSPHRPNPIGLSAVAIEKIDTQAEGGPEIHVRGVDLLDGTPVLDIKPYVPYADSIPQANSGWAEEPIVRAPVEFTPQAESATEARSLGHPNLRELIVEMLELDPRPAFQQRNLPRESPSAQGTRFGFKLFDYDVKWEIRDAKFIVLDVVDLKSS
jgi:tRNA-Thr(GGU) m(6)t(6)A37 methyltransferase TsaA